jgi:integrase
MLTKFHSASFICNLLTFFDDIRWDTPLAAKEIKKQILDRLEGKLDALPWYVQEFIQHKRRKMSPHSLLNYVHDYIAFFNWLVQESFYHGLPGDVPLEVLDKLRIIDIGGLYAYLEMDDDIDSKKTIHRKMASFSSLFYYLSNIAEDENFYPYLKRNVMAKFEVETEKETAAAKADRIRGKILRGDDIHEFRDFVKRRYGELIKKTSNRAYKAYLRNRERDTAIISLILGSELRVSDVGGLDMNDINFKEGSVNVTRKGGKADTISFSDVAKEDLTEYLNVRNTRYKVDDRTKPVFLSSPTGPNGTVSRIRVRTIQTFVEKYAKAFGKNGLSVHKLRHSFATNYYVENNNLAQLQQQLGHSDINTTLLYTHLTSEVMKEAVNKADKKK